MRKTVLTLMGALFLFSPIVQAERIQLKDVDKYYGNLTAVNHDDHELTAFNKRKKKEGLFNWDDKTQFIYNKKPIDASTLKIGQSLIIYYTNIKGENKIHRLTVRKTRKRKKIAS